MIPVDEVVSSAAAGEHLFDFLIRTVCACLLAGILGRERSLKQKVAGVRTHLIVAGGASLIASCGALLAVPGSHIDPTRLASQILSGIGFVGAGAIMRKGSMTVGVTTAATLFFAAAIGIACGLGECSYAAVGTIVLRLMMHVSHRLLPLDELGGKYIKVACAPNRVEQALQLLRKRGRINSMRKFNDRIEIVAHIEDISWAELDSLISVLLHKPDIYVVEQVND